MQGMRGSQLGISASPAEARMLAVCSEEKMDFKGDQENFTGAGGVGQSLLEKPLSD